MDNQKQDSRLNLNPIYHSTKHEETLISPKNLNPFSRTATFLKPFSSTKTSTLSVSHEQLPFSYQWPSKITFKGWKFPQKNYQKWMDKLALQHATTWQQLGICDSIMSSLYEVKINKSLILGISEFWNEKTNTFVFPWGEGTVTLEDVMILGGFPLIGESADDCSLNWEMVNVVEELSKVRRLVLKKGKRDLHYNWMKHFTESDSANELEHVAFLSLWLSRYVLPSDNEDVIGNDVFKIAIYLSLGKKVALGPAVLASLYCNLRLLNEQGRENADSIAVLGLFQLLQLWIFEHFPLLGPVSPNVLSLGEPRVARWHKLYSKVDNIQIIRSVLKLRENFVWRPYAENLKNWRHLAWYEEEEQFLTDNLVLDEELQAFVRCLCACELVGMNYKEKYLPYRVAMQFGLDQDIPGELSSFDFSLEGVGFFVPEREFEPGVSERYFSWWNEYKNTRENGIGGGTLIHENLKVPSSGLVGVDDTKGCVVPAQVCEESKPKDSHASSKCHCKVACECEGEVDDLSLAFRNQMEGQNITLEESDVTNRGENEQQDSCIFAESNGLKDSPNISKLSAMSNLEDRRASMTPESPNNPTIQATEDIKDQNDFVLPGGLKCFIGSGIRRRSYRLPDDCNSNGHSRKRKELRREVSDQVNNQGRGLEEVNRKNGKPFDDLLNSDHSSELNKRPETTKPLVNGALKDVERRKAGESQCTPIVIDDFEESHVDSDQNSDLEKRLRRVEKCLGILR